MSFLNLKEASEFMKLMPDTLRSLAKSGLINGVKWGKEWRFYEEDLIADFRNSYGKKFKTDRTGLKRWVSISDQIPNTGKLKSRVSAVKELESRLAPKTNKKLSN